MARWTAGLAWLAVRAWPSVLAWPALLPMPSAAFAQSAPPGWLDRLRSVVAAADSFTDRRGQPPVFEAYRTESATGQPTLVGYAFLTSDIPPEQRGFTGPIEVLVGMDLEGVLTGVQVIEYTESHRATRGDFLAEPGFQEQFTGKRVTDAFRVRRDVEGISGATISVDAMSRGIRNAAREVAAANGVGRIARAAVAPPVDPVSLGIAELVATPWEELMLRGLGQRLSVLDRDKTIAEVTLVYLRDDEVARLLMGPSLWSQTLDRAGARLDQSRVLFAGVDGPSAGALNLARLAIVQGRDTIGLEPEDVLLFGPPREGKLEDQFRMARVLLFASAVDMTQPATFVLDLRPALGAFEVEYPGRGGRVDADELQADEVDTDRSTGSDRARTVVLVVILLVNAVGLAWRLLRRSPKA